MHLVLFVAPDGIHQGGWRHPSAALSPDGFSFYKNLAQQAEAAKLDMLFIADKLAVDDVYGGDIATTLRYRPSRASEPLTLLSALAVSTTRIGLGGTISTSYTEPFHTARLLASIDHLSGGRAAWNAVTSVSDAEARNFGREEHYAHDVRYRRAAEYLEVTRKLWDSWGEGAVAPDRVSGTYADPGHIHYVNHHGDWFDIKGPLNVPRPPQGHPVLIQAGASGAFQDLAAQNAEIVFAVYPDLERGRESYRTFKAKVAAAGRPAASVKVLPGMVPIVANSDAEARTMLAELDALVTVEAGLSFMSGSMNYDLSIHSINGPVPDIRSMIRGSKGRFDYVIGHAIDQGWTLANLGRWYGSSLSFAKFVGTAEMVASEMETWIKTGAADGFVVMPATMPVGADRFLSEVVPLLQQKGLFREDYRHSTLRGHLGLAKPMNQYEARDARPDR